MRFLLLLLSTLLPTTANAACMAFVVRPTPAVESPTAILQPGVFGPVTQVEINKKTGAMAYCAHGNYCYSFRDLQLSPDCQWLNIPEYDDGESWILFLH